MILVVGATGKVGQEVADSFRRRTSRCARSCAIRCAPRTCASRACRWSSATSASPRSLDAALSGVDRVFLASPADQDQVALQGNLVQACQPGRRAAASSRSRSPAARTPRHRSAAGTGRRRSRSRPRGWGSRCCGPISTCSRCCGFAPSIATRGSLRAALRGRGGVARRRPGRRVGRRRRPDAAPATTARSTT